MKKIFVYGTLMKGLSNHYLLQEAKFICPATLNGYGLYCVTPDFPGIVPMHGAAVRGEVYEVNNKTLEHLDALEAEGALYVRQKAECTLGDGTLIQAYVYVWRGKTSKNDFVPYDFTPWHPGVLNEVETGIGKNFFYFFAYGRYCNVREVKKLFSNSGVAADPDIIGVGVYRNHKLAFTRKKNNGYGALDLIPADGDYVLGTIYRIPLDLLPVFNKKEGHPHCYTRKAIRVICGGKPMMVQAYLVVDKHLEEVAPDQEYYGIVLQGMKDRYPVYFINKYLIEHCNDKFSFNNPLLPEQLLYHYNLHNEYQDTYFSDLIRRLAIHLGDDNDIVENIKPTPEMFRILVKLTDMYIRGALDYSHLIPRELTNRLAAEFERLTGLFMRRVPNH
ncbi:MAG TPA: gamma-glutamylcyclotransferase [Firmicutes bacterium]|nr:gamma-glutamylcyclotransferase [Bacillota bacterium]